MFVLPSSLTVHNIKEVQDELLLKIEDNIKQKKEEFKVDAAELEDIDAAGLQLLLATNVTADKEGFEFKLLNCTDFLLETFRVSGANDILTMEEDQDE